MSKQEFLTQLRNKLSGLPQKDIDERLSFYSEIIDDRIEEGLSEDDAVSTIGDINDVVKQVVAETSFTKIAKQRIKPKRRLKVWEIILLILGSPIWLSLGIAAVAVVLSLYVSLWAVIISLWACFVALVGSSLGTMAGGIAIICKGESLTGIAMIGAAIFGAGFSIFMFYGCKAATKGILKLTKKLAICIKNCFIKREEA